MSGNATRGNLRSAHAMRFLAWLAALVSCGTILSRGQAANFAHGAGSSASPLSGATSGSEIQLKVDAGTRFQTFEAWRATASGPQFQGKPGRVPAPLFSKILDDLVDLGINGFRVELFAYPEIAQSPYDFKRTDARLEGEVLPMHRRVSAKGETFSTYVSMIGDYRKNWPKPWPTDPKAYANMVAAFLEAHGPGKPIPFTPTYWLVVNEPNVNGFDCCRGLSSLADYVNAVAAKIRSLPAPLSSVKLEMPDTAQANFSGYALGAFIGLDRKAKAQVGLLAYHSYDYTRAGIPPFSGRNLFRDLARKLHIRTAQTEICCMKGWNGSYTQALGWARDIYWNLTEGDVSVWEPLAVMSSCSQPGCVSGGQDPIMVEPDFSSYHKFAAFYGLRQYAHFIRPNYARVKMHCENCKEGVNGAVGLNVKPVAFLSPAGKLVLVILNDQSAAQTMRISGLPANAGFEITGVEPVQTMPRALGTPTADAAGTLTWSFPAQAIVTFQQH